MRNPFALLRELLLAADAAARSRHLTLYAQVRDMANRTQEIINKIDTVVAAQQQVITNLKADNADLRGQLAAAGGQDTVDFNAVSKALDDAASQPADTPAPEANLTGQPLRLP